MTIPQPDRPVAPRATLAAAAVLAVTLLLGAVAVLCSAPQPSTHVVAGASGASGEVEADPAGEAPVGSGDLPHAGLVAERTAAMRDAVDAVRTGPAATARPAPEGAFGPDPDPCIERNRFLARDLAPITYHPRSSGCLVERGLLDDPYLGRTTTYTDDRSDRVAIDRIVSLEFAWQHGAAGWSAGKRRAFASDARNQLVADARQVRAKAGRGPAGWLPPHVALRCAYVARFAEVAAAYELTVTPADQDVARRQCPIT